MPQLLRSSEAHAQTASTSGLQGDPGLLILSVQVLSTHPLAMSPQGTMVEV